MPTLYDRFAKFSGAKIATKTEPEPTLAVDLPDVIEEGTTDSVAEEETNYVQEKFKKNTAPWKNPKITLGIVAIISLGAALTGAAIFNGNFQMPDFGKASAAKPTNDDIAPQPAGDGKWQSAAIGMGLGEGFQKEGERKNPYLDSKPTKSNAKDKLAKGNKSKAVSGSGVTPTYRTMAVRPAQVPPAYVSPAPTRYTDYTPARVYPSRPSYSRSPVSTPQQAPQQALEKQLSPQERIAAMLAATSTGTNGTPSGGAVASAPSDYIPAASQSSQYPQPQFVSQRQFAQGQPAAQQMAYLPSEAAVIDGQSQTLINRSASAKATLLNGIAFSANDYASLAGQPVEIELAQSLGEIPKGARIIAVVDAGDQRSSNGAGTKAVVRLKATAIAIGDSEIPLPENALLITGNDGSPLIASRGGNGFLRTVGGIIGTLAGGAGQSNVGAGQNARFGDSSYLTSVGTNIATGFIGNAAKGLQQSGTSDVLVLKAGKSIKISVLKPFALPQLSQLSQLSDQSPLSQRPVNEQVAAQIFPEPTDSQLIAIGQEVSDADQN